MNRQEIHRRKVFTRRTAVLAAGKLGLMSILGARLYYLQVVNAEKYHVLAEENRISMRLLAPTRGRILDRSGTELVQNRRNYCLILVPEAVGNAENTLEAVSRWVTLDEQERKRILRDARRQTPFTPVVIREHLDWEQVATIKVNNASLPGISIDARPTRYYPHGSALAHILGYVAAVSETEKQRTEEPLFNLPDFPIGKNGIEKIHDSALRGSAGNLHVEVNAHGRVIRELSRREGAPGHDISLTIDLELQKFADARLGEESAAAVLIDIPTGEVLTLASAPAYDPNAFTRGLTVPQWNELRRNPYAPLRNKATTGEYPPGSTFKLIVALAALEAGIVGPDDGVFCPSFMTIGNRRFHCWKRGGHGTLSMADAIAQSCDVYFYDIALKVGIERIAAMAKRLGLGVHLGLDLPNEESGLVPTPAWKRARYNERWHRGETAVVGIGQSFVLATPLQLAVMIARIADGARAVTPRMTRRLHRKNNAAPRERPAPQPVALDISAASLAAVRDGLNRAVNTERGTAHSMRIDDPQRAMAGKTGTSQVARITRAERLTGIVKNEDRPWRLRDHGLFVAYAPIHAPRFAVSVVVEHGGGSKAAIPIARDILLEALRRSDIASQPALQDV